MTPNELASLHASCFTTPRPWTASELRVFLADPATILVECADGFALGRIIADEAELLTLAIAPTARRQGLGRGLLQRFEADAAARGAATGFLEVSAENQPAIALYQNAGYDILGARKGYYRTPSGHRIDARIYGKHLSADKTG